MSDQGKKASDLDLESLFLLGAGRFTRGLERARLSCGARLRVTRVAMVAATVSWLPLVVLAALDGVAWGNHVQVPFLKDFLPYGQCLVAIPLLMFGEAFLNGMVMTLLIAYKPRWVATFHDAWYLDGK